MVAFGSIAANTDVTFGGVAPGEELAYNQITAHVAITATTAAAATLVIEGTARTYDGSPIIVEFFSPNVLSPNSLGGSTVINLWDGGTDLGFIGQVKEGGSVQGGCTVSSRRRLTPSAGTHNYRILAWATPSAGQVNGGPGGIDAHVPAFIRVVRV